MKFHLTYGTSRCFGYGNGYGYGYGYGSANGFGNGRGYGDGDGYSNGFGYYHGNGCTQVNKGIHPVVSADEDVIVAIRTATLRGLTHIDT